MAKVTLIAISIPLAGAQMQQEQPEAFSETSGVHAGTNMNSVCYSFVAHNDGHYMSIHYV